MSYTQKQDYLNRFYNQNLEYGHLDFENSHYGIKNKENDKLNNQTLIIYADRSFSKDELAKLKWVKGHNKIEIIINNQLLKIPGEFNITSEMIDKMKSLNGVMKIDFVE